MLKFIFCFVASFLFFGSAFAQTKNAQLPVSFPNATILNQLHVYFCDDWFENMPKNDTVFLRPGQKKEICIVFQNASTGEVEVSAWFTRASITWNSKSCENDFRSSWNVFNAHVDYFPEDFLFTIRPQESLIKKVKISYDQPGNYLGCLPYMVPWQNSGSKALITAVLRKVSYIDVVVTWSAYNLGRWDDIKFAYKDNDNMVWKVIIAIIWIFLLYSIFTFKGKKVSYHHTKK